MSSNQSHTPSPLGPGAQGAAPTRSRQEDPTTRRFSRRASNEATYWHRRNLEARRREQVRTDPGPSSGSSVPATPDVNSGVAPGLTPCPVPTLRISRHYRSDPPPSNQSTQTPQAEEDIPTERAGMESRIVYVDTYQAESDIPTPSLLPWATTHRVQPRVGAPYFTPLVGTVVYYNWNRVVNSTGNVPGYFAVYPPAPASSASRFATTEENQRLAPNIRLTGSPAASGPGQPSSDNAYILSIVPRHTLPDHAGQSSSSSSDGEDSDEEESREPPAHTLDGANDVETPGSAHDGAVPEDSAAYTLIASAQDGVATCVEDARPLFNPENPFISSPHPRIPLAAYFGTLQETQQFLIAVTKPTKLLSVEELFEHFPNANSSRPQDPGAADEAGEPGPALIVAVEEAAATSPPDGESNTGEGEPAILVAGLKPGDTGRAGNTIIFAVEDAENSDPLTGRTFEKFQRSTQAGKGTDNTRAGKQVAINEAATSDAVIERAAAAKAHVPISSSQSNDSAVSTAEPAAVPKVQKSTPAGRGNASGAATVAGKAKKKSSTAAGAVVNTVRNFGRRRAAGPADQGRRSNNSAHDIDDAHDACNSGRRGAAGPADRAKRPNSSAPEIGGDGAADMIYELRSGHAPSSMSDCTSSHAQVSLTYDIDKDPHIRIKRQQRSGAPSDIRSHIAPANDLGKDMNGRFVRYNWTEEPEETKNFLSSTTFLGRAIGHWRESVPNLFYGGSSLGNRPDVEKFTALLAKKIDCDVNPQDLALQTPYVARDTPADPNDAGKAQDAPREHMYSSLEKRKEKRAAKRDLSSMHYDSEAEVDELGLGASDQSAPKVQSFEPDVVCFLRPASKEDVGNIQAIYNHEVTHGTQSRDIHKVTDMDIKSTFDMCKAGNLPFIVAIAGLEHDVREPKGLAKKWQTGEPEKGELLGFAFLSNYYVGLCGATDATGGSCVRLTIIVHPQHRRKFIGHALMDKMMHLVCPNYTYQDMAAFADHEASLAHCGTFRHVLIETMAQEGDQRSLDGFAQFLGRFGFSKLFELKQSHDHRGSLYNQTTWHREIRPVQPAQ
ncbi:hypothetical protein MAPG_03343 [Magnaporthiopsis poae ATCC 64411]|uniref:N-acetyltransferase domain-containing protein n=1 Tax=Magnaporthiopsis poae (strain ATCC 64411 / 73-15) TaxID=644358 RepID=A0A0C4DTS1_MAGP6|nr:hypothetical protein MAPG_03343 [Magnaporthiopsis poae ATCC 64411]